MKEQSYITFPLFEPFRELLCVFSTRKGGTSSGIFSSQNMGNFQNDDRQNILANRANFYNRLNIPEKSLILPGQIHSANCRIVDHASECSDTDSLITNVPGLYLGVQTADCFPVFLYTSRSKTIAIIHAGWRGVASGIIDKTVTKIIDRFKIDPLDIYAVIGPGLQKECFEVGSDVYEQFPKAVLFPHPDPLKRYLDLSGFIRNQLIENGISDTQIYTSSDCTKCLNGYYYSYRRDSINSGRMLGIIGLRK